jgi:hypothetical protein
VDDLNQWAFWQSAIAGGKPETTPGTPHAGYYTAREYVSIPHGEKRVCTFFPTAVWHDETGWHARIDRLKSAFTISGQDEVDDVFRDVHQRPITYEKYQEMIATLEDYRK